MTPEKGRLHRFDAQGKGREAMRLDGKIAVVTGGARGIGRAIARGLCALRAPGFASPISMTMRPAGRSRHWAADAFACRSRCDAHRVDRGDGRRGEAAGGRHRHSRQQCRDLRHGADRARSPKKSYRQDLRRQCEGPALHAAGGGARDDRARRGRQDHQHGLAGRAARRSLWSPSIAPRRPRSSASRNRRASASSSTASM